MNEARWARCHETITIHPLVGADMTLLPGLCQVAPLAERNQIRQQGADGQLRTATVSGRDLDTWLTEHRLGLLGW